MTINEQKRALCTLSKKNPLRDNLRQIPKDKLLSAYESARAESKRTNSHEERCVAKFLWLRCFICGLVK